MFSKINKTIFFPCFLFGYLLFFSATLYAAKTNTIPQDPNWQEFNTGLKQASQEKKYVLLDFYANWCSYCKMMKETTYKDLGVLKELKENFISIKINTEGNQPISWDNQAFTEKGFSSYMDVIELPTLIFLSPDLEVIGHYPSFADKKLMHSLLTYVSSGAREKGVSFNEFLESSKK